MTKNEKTRDKRIIAAKVRFFLSFLGCLIGLCGVLVLPTYAQSQAERLEAERSQRALQLDEVNARLSQDADSLRRLEQDIEAIKRDRQELARQAVLAAKAVQQMEGDVSAGEERLKSLARQEQGSREILAGKHEVIAELLAALQRLSRNPPPAILVAPESALQTVRSAIVLGAVLPELRSEAEIVLGDLARLRTIRAEIGEEIKTRQAQLALLTENRTRLELLTEEKKRQLSTSEQDVRLSRQRVEELANESQNLRELLSRLGEAFQSARKSEEDRRAAEAAPTLPVTGNEKAIAEPNTATQQGPNKRSAALLPGRLPNSAIPFEQAKGQIALPASGQILRKYGEDDGAGSLSRGVFLRTRAGAAVTSPAEGWIVYAGAFRSYGQIVIVNVGAGHHILLAGMERITVEPGQFVLAGESIAQMGQTILATAAALELDSTRPILYIEFRKDGVTVDPAPWWVITSEKARG